MLDIAQARNLEAMAVTLELSLLVAAVILYCKLHAAILEIMLAKAHELVRLTSEVRSDMTCSAIIFLEEFISIEFLSSKSAVVSAKPLVET